MFKQYYQAVTEALHINNTPYLNGLNESQKEAVLYTSGPLLVLASAGTGKTRALTSRIAHLILNQIAHPQAILAVTFTNKAAREMKDRVKFFVGDIAHTMWIGTFHSIAAKILRVHAEKLGLSKDFVIIDYNDQVKLMKQILKDFNLDEKKNSYKSILYYIERFKDKAWLPHRVPTSEAPTVANGKIIAIYQEYQRRLKSYSALDFGDLLLYNIELLNENSEICEYYQEKFKYILIDEYQDTNLAQYLWIRILAQKYSNICCVGDDDQSIYGWRGAEITNILRFDKDFQDAYVVKLERNYRSTKHILEAARGIISLNKTRHIKDIWTDNAGEIIKLNYFYDDRHEAKYIADEADILSRLKKHKLSDIAILIRAGYQSLVIEEALNFLRVPYRIIGGAKFYDKAEIKDAIAYLRLVLNNNDDLAFHRIINIPRRGVGDTSLQIISQISKEHSISMIKATEQAIEAGVLKGKIGQSLKTFLMQINVAILKCYALAKR